MLLLLPAAAYAVLFRWFETRYTSRREAALVAAAWWTLALVALTEGLSLNRSLRPYPLAVGWFCVAAVVGVLCRTRALGAPAKPSLREWLRQAVQAWGRPEWIMGIGLATISALVGLTAAVSPPNGSDQLQYHLPRVVEWASRHSVHFFPTNYYVQLFSPPLAEWTILHTYLLTGGDYCAGLVQWFAFLGSALSVSLIARELGAGLRAQLLAAFLCVTLPQGILAASGDKNDWVLAFWLCAAVFFLLRWHAEPGWRTSLNTGIAIGAALLAKGSVYAFLPPILLAILVWGRRRQWRFILRGGPVAVAMILLLNGAQWSRNYSLCGSIFGPSTPNTSSGEKYTVDRISLPGIASNVVRETAMELITPVDAINRRETALARALISMLGVNPDDRALTNYHAFSIPHAYFDLDEYYAGNPFHLLLAGIAGVALLLRNSRIWRLASAPFALPVQRPRTGAATALALGIAGAFLLYCSLFKWEIWCARLHLPLFVLASAVTAVVFCRTLPKLVIPLALAALLLAVRPTLMNATRPLLFTGGLHSLSAQSSILVKSRPQLYFTQQKELESAYLAAAAFVRSSRCADVGIDTSLRLYAHEYPLMELGRDPQRQTSFRYVGVHNLSSQYADKSDSLAPCLVICPDCGARKDKWNQYLPDLPDAHPFGSLLLFSRSSSAAANQLSQANWPLGQPQNVKK